LRLQSQAKSLSSRKRTSGAAGFGARRRPYMRDKLFRFRLFEAPFFQNSREIKRLRALRLPFCTAPVDNARPFSQSETAMRPRLADPQTGGIIPFDAELNT